MRRELGIADRVRFLGWRRDLATIYGATDVFLLTSRNEGTPVALIEAMASGVPGVSTDVGGVKDVIESARRRRARAPMAMRPDWPRTSCATWPIPTCAGDRRARARAAVLDRYSLDRLVDDIAALYRDLLAR